MKPFKFLKKKLSKEKVVDESLPLGLKIGSKLSFNTSNLVLIKDQMLMDKIPKELYVFAYGEYNLEGSNGYRFYLGESIDVQLILDILIDPEYTEYKIYTLYEELYLDEDGWDEWLNEETGIIGSSAFEIEEEYGAYEYTRTVSDSPKRIEPFKYKETLYKNNNNIIYNHLSMSYGRWVESGIVEYALIEVIEEEENNAYVNILIGTDINKSQINVIY